MNRFIRSKTTVKTSLKSVSKEEAGNLEKEVTEVLQAIFPEDVDVPERSVVMNFLKENIETLNRTLIILPCKCEIMHAFDYQFRISRDGKAPKILSPYEYLEALNLHYLDIEEDEDSVEITDDMMNVAKRVGNIYSHIFSEHRYGLEKDFAGSLWKKCLYLLRLRALYHKKYSDSKATRILVKCMMLYNNHLIHKGFPPFTWLIQ